MVQRQVEEEEEEEVLQTKEASGQSPGVTSNLKSNINTLRGGGQPLPESVCAFFEPRFDHDFSHVRVHTSNDAIQMSRELNAEAFTHGRDIFFNAGRYNPSSTEGKRLFAHELTHVVQQGATKATGTIQRQSNDDEERRFSEDCSRYMGMEGEAACEFYRCREANTGHACGSRGYYLGYGLKYCERFSRLLRPRLSDPGKRWLDRTRLYLMEYIHRNVPWDAPCANVKQSAFDSHPGCYVRGGICFLPSSDWMKILEIIDSADNDLKQGIITGISCIFNWLPLAFPATSLGAGGGYRGLMERDRRRVFGF